LRGFGNFQKRLREEVVNAFEQKGSAFGNDRFRSWRRQFTKLLDEHLPAETSVLDSKLSHMGFVVLRNESDAQRFWREDGETMDSYIESLIIDIENGEYETPEDEEEDSTNMASPAEGRDLSSVFIVHGHDGEAKQRTARFVEKLGFNAIILHEQASRSRTIIEKIEKYSKVGFAIVLYTADDKGNANAKANKGELNPRARQNVVFEHGYLMARIGRENVVPLVEPGVELPGDISGIVYISDTEWQIDIAKEMKDAGYQIDFNTII
jgi:predicted nucleotide-binding protein